MESAPPTLADALCRNTGSIPFPSLSTHTFLSATVSVQKHHQRSKYILKKFKLGEHLATSAIKTLGGLLECLSNLERDNVFPEGAESFDGVALSLHLNHLLQLQFQSDLPCGVAYAWEDRGVDEIVYLLNI